MRSGRLLLGLLGCLVFPASAAEPGPEVLLPVHEARDAYTPSAAFGGELYLIAWQSGRLGPGDLRKGVPLIGEIVGCRVDKAGRVLDAAPFVICGAPDQQEDPRVAFGGGVFLVVWQDCRNGKDWDLYGARVSPEGKVLDRDGFLISGGAHNQAKPRVTWDEKAFVVVWQDFRQGSRYALYTARISKEGKSLDPDGVKVASGDFYHCFSPALASPGGGRSFVVHIAEGMPVDGYRAPGVQGWFISDGRPEAKPAYTMNKQSPEEAKQGPDARGDPMALVAGGGGFLLSWKNDSSLGRGFGPDGNAARFDGKGARKESYSFSGGAGKRDARRILNPSLVWDGSAFGVAWHEFVREKQDGCPADAVFFQRLSAEGQRQGVPQRLAGTFANPASAPAAASDGAGGILVAYERHPEKGDLPIRIALRTVPQK